MASEITVLWTQIAQWLRVNAPATFACLLADTLDLLHGGAARRASLNHRHPKLGAPVVTDGHLHWGQD